MLSLKDRNFERRCRDQLRRNIEKDLAFALVKMQNEELVGAYLNAAVATIRFAQLLTDKQHGEAIAEVERLIAERCA